MLSTHKTHHHDTKLVAKDCNVGILMFCLLGHY